MPVATPTPNAPFRPDVILLKFESGSPAADHSRALQAIGGRLLDVIDGVEGTARIGLGQGVTVEKALEILSKLPGVKFAEPDYVISVQALSDDANVVAGQTWGLYGDQGAVVNLYGSQATEAWAVGHVGSTKVAVGVADTGIDYTHPDLYLNVWLNQREIPTAFRAGLTDADADGLISFRDLNDARNGGFVSDLNANGRIDAGDLLRDVRWENLLDDDTNGYVDDLVGWDFVNNDNDPLDDHGHGTHVSGTIGAVGGNGVGVAGVGWNTQIVPLKILDAAGSGSSSNGARGVDYVTTAAKGGTGVDFVAINHSWGGLGYSQTLLDAIVRGAKQDVLTVAAAGNGGSDRVADNNDVTGFYPSSYSTLAGAGYEAVVSVTAIGSTGGMAAWANFGANSVDLGAPGVGIYSTTRGGGYGTMSGTSMASPHVAGAIGVYAAAHAGASAAQIRAALLESVTPTTSLLDKVATDGRLDVSRFVQTVVAEVPISTPVVSEPVAPITGLAAVGTAAADLMTGTVYADTLSGQGGSDTLDGGAGADSLAGGAGDDTYVVDQSGDVVLELAGGGIDTVRSAVSHTLGAQVENLTLNGAAANATGNELANILIGNSGANFMFGAAGADRLDGGAGADTLNGGLDADTLLGGSGDDRLIGGGGADLYVGGSGKDVFQLHRGEATGDAIQDFAKGDRIQLTGYSAGSTLTKAAGSSTDWIITDGASGATETLRLLNGYSLKTGDFLFG